MQCLVPRQSKLITSSESAHIFLSQLQLVKLNSVDDAGVPADCYTGLHFNKAIQDAGISFNEQDTDAILMVLMDMNATMIHGVKLGATLISKTSLNDLLKLAVNHQQQSHHG